MQQMENNEDEIDEWDDVDIEPDFAEFNGKYIKR